MKEIGQTPIKFKMMDKAIIGIGTQYLNYLFIYSYQKLLAEIREMLKAEFKPQELEAAVFDYYDTCIHSISYRYSTPIIMQEMI